jgi:hypothetical protein
MILQIEKECGWACLLLLWLIFWAMNLLVAKRLAGTLAMTDVANNPEAHAQFLAVLDTLPWCKQGDAVLVAVHKCIPEVLEVMKQHEAKVFPGNMTVKINRSTLAEFRSKFDEGQPVPVLLVWKVDIVEIWFRTHKSEDYPYDTWSDAKAAAYERECVIVPTSELGETAGQSHLQHVASSKPCPSMIPNL